MIRSMVKVGRKKPFTEHTSNKKERVFLMSQLECRIHTAAFLNAATTGFRGGACAWSLKILCLAVLQPGVPSNHPPAPSFFWSLFAKVEVRRKTCFWAAQHWRLCFSENMRQKWSEEKISITSTHQVIIASPQFSRCEKKVTATDGIGSNTWFVAEHGVS